jgi:hypothetical protein
MCDTASFTAIRVRGFLAVASADGGQTLTLKYKDDGTQTVHARQGVPIVTFQPGQRADAKPGAKIFMPPRRPPTAPSPPLASRWVRTA